MQRLAANSPVVPPLASPPSAPRRRLLRRLLPCAALVAAPALLALKPGDRFGLKDLEDEPNMTAKRFASLFEDFAYDYHSYVQSPNAFLRKRTGDCDDYAILADHILGRRAGLKTRLIRVELVNSRVNHVVCYVTENKAYLDYNNRKYFFTLTRSGPTLREIAGKVADSFGKNWTVATEYTYSYEAGRSQPVYSVVKTDPPDQDPDRNGPPPR